MPYTGFAARRAELDALKFIQEEQNLNRSDTFRWIIAKAVETLGGRLELYYGQIRFVPPTERKHDAV